LSRLHFGVQLMSPKSRLLSSLVAFSITLSPVYAASPLMVEKNLFSQERKPSSGEAQTAAAPTGPPVPPKTIQLDGIMIRGNLRKALLRLKGGPGPKEKSKKDSPFTTVSDGEKVSDYTVTKIGSRSISLEKGGQVFEVFLYAEGKVLPPLAATPGPGASGATGQPGQPPPPSKAQGAASQADFGLEGSPGGDLPPVAIDRNARPAQAAAQGQRGPRRAAPPSEEPAEGDEGDDEGLEDDGQ
jgi:hypothetical protein